MGLLILILFLAVLGVAAILWGVDSNDVLSDPRRPAERGGIS